MQVKLDELIHVMKGAQNALLDLEELEEEELDRIVRAPKNSGTGQRGASKRRQGRKKL